MIKNITSNIKPQKTIMEIEDILSKFGAGGVYKEFDSDGNVNQLMFYLNHKGQKIPFKMPMLIDKAKEVIKKAAHSGKIQKKYLQEPALTEKAQSVGWRVIKDWIHSQLSLLEIQFAEPLQIFLPYAYNGVTNETVYEQIEKQKSKFLALENKSE